ncbi:hypothetical protein A2U01_0015555, partial [Trifolium medium]|nr:hypothetical protein [Trifolium medium]
MEISADNFSYVIDCSILNFTPPSTPEEEEEHAILVLEIAAGIK